MCGLDCKACSLCEHCLAYKRVATGELGGHAKESKEGWQHTVDLH